MNSKIGLGIIGCLILLSGANALSFEDRSVVSKAEVCKQLAATAASQIQSIDDKLEHLNLKKQTFSEDVAIRRQVELEIEDLKAKDAREVKSKFQKEYSMLKCLYELNGVKYLAALEEAQKALLEKKGALKRVNGANSIIDQLTARYVYRKAAPSRVGDPWIKPDGEVSKHILDQFLFPDGSFNPMAQ